jgi:hypothetical protein
MNWSDSMVAAATNRDEPRVRELMMFRWPNNEAPPNPMSTFSETHARPRTIDSEIEMNKEFPTP